MEKKSTYTVLLSSIKMAVATFLSRILGLVREQSMAMFFGASSLTDAFLVAYRIPNLLRDLLAEGAFSSAFVPTFVESKKEQEQKAKELLWELFFLLGGLTFIITLLMIVFAPELIKIFAPEFVSDQHKFETTVKLTQIMAPYLMLASLTALFTGALNSLNLFFLPALSPALFNVVMISTIAFGAYYFSDLGIEPIYSLAIGVLIGGICQTMMQIPLLYKNKYGFLKPSQIFSIKAKKVIKLLGPGLIGFAATQINLLINTILATSIVGAVSWLNYSFRLFQLPVGILGVSIGNSNLVHFSEAWKSGHKVRARELLQSSYFLSFLVVLPAMAIMTAVPNEIVNLIYQRGKFDEIATTQTALGLFCYAIGLIPYGLYKIWVPTFYVLDQQKVPVYSSLISIVCNIIFCVALSPHYGFIILALGTSLSMLINASIQTFVLKNSLELNWSFFFNKRILKILVSSLFIFVLLERSTLFLNFNDFGFWGKVLILGTKGVVAIFMYATSLYVLGEKEAVEKIRAKIFAKLNKKIN